MWGSSPSDVYAGCDGTILHSTGDGTWVAQSPGVTSYYTALGGSGADDVYAAGAADGNGVLIVSKHDPASDVWQRERTPAIDSADLYGISVTATDVYAVGRFGTILHR